MPRTLPVKRSREHGVDIARPLWTGAGVPGLPRWALWGSRGIARVPLVLSGMRPAPLGTH